VTGAFAITLFVVSLVVAVLLHELGHLLTAKRFGMRADRYFVGFGPTLWSTRRGETEYGLKAFPLGGFVSIRGMTPLDERRRPLVDEVFSPDALAQDRRAAAEASDGDPLAQPNLPAGTWRRMHTVLRERGTSPQLATRIVDRTRTQLPDAPTAADARTALAAVLTTEVGESERLGDLPHRLLRGDEGRFFHDRPAWQRAVVLVTGPATHLLIAFAVLVGAFLTIPQPTGGLDPIVGGVLEGSPAEQAGLQAGDRLLAVEDTASNDYAVLRDAIRARPEQATTLTVDREGEQLAIELTPTREVDETTGEEFGLAGFLPSLSAERLGATDALERALLGDEELAPMLGVWPMLTGSIDGLARIFSPEGLGGLVSQAAGQQERDEAGAVSLVGAASLAGQAAGNGSEGIMLFLVLLASINVFFFIFNMVPLPPFDGGHLAVLVIEKAVNTGRRLRGRAQDFAVDPRAIAAVAIPVIAVLGVVLIATLWLDISDPIRLG
jgi:regulator of sigma E protease